MSNIGDVLIAGSKTVDDWRAFRVKLVPGGDRNLWEEAFRSYYRPRLSLRYLDPIEIIQKYGTFQGEGFSIMAIQCSLIEFLESTAQGLTYHYIRKGDRLGSYEYSNSAKLFVDFLSTRQPFVNDFNRQLAHNFYEGVRCGLLHEARTKKGWTIRGRGPSGSRPDQPGRASVS